MINEVMQWMVLAFLSVFVFGLTRQLGMTLVRGHEARAATQGPDIGKRIPRSLLTRDLEQRLAELFQAGGSDWAALLAVSEDCPGCDLVIGTLEEEGRPTSGAPLVAITGSAEQSFRERLDSLFDIVIVDSARLREADLRSTPFVVLIDRDMKVVHKSAARSLGAAVDDWRGAPLRVVQSGQRPAPDPTGAAL